VFEISSFGVRVAEMMEAFLAGALKVGHAELGCWGQTTALFRISALHSCALCTKTAVQNQNQSKKACILRLQLLKKAAVVWLLQAPRAILGSLKKQRLARGWRVDVNSSRLGSNIF
jgi:hypothetical protein